jgi:cell division protein FtsZ
MYEVNEASTLITEAAHEDAEITFGAVIDDALADEVRVTVIATGFGRDDKPTFAEKVSQLQSSVQAQATSMDLSSLPPIPDAPPVQHSMPASWPQPPTLKPFVTGAQAPPPIQQQQQPPQQQQIEMPATYETNQKPVLPRDILLAKARAFRESQSTTVDSKIKKPEPVQLSMPVNADAGQSSGPDLESARRLAREVGRQFDEKTYDIPAFIRKNQRPPEQL